jgi:hypothetical protein
MARGDIPLDIVTDDKGTPVLPDERFANATQVRGLAQTMIQADNKRAWMRDRVDALVNGWPTYPKSVTAAKGFGWFPRVNYREAEGLIQSQQTPLFDLVTEVDRCMEIDLDIDASSEEEKADWEDSIAKNWTWLLFKRWRKSFNYHIPLSQREMLVHGIGAHVWPNKFTWVPRTPRSGQILFPEVCSLDFDSDGKYFMLRDFVPGEDVYGFIRNEKAARERGWFPDNVWQTLVKAQKQNQRITGTSSNIEEMQRKIRRGDYGYWASSQVGLWINWMFVKEYEGGVSLYAIEEQIISGNKDGGYLFKKRFLWKEWGEVLVLFPIDIGNGDIQSVRGYGWRTKDFFELSNRVNNAMVAQVLISAFPQMKQNQPNMDPEKMRLMRMGALNITPYGLEPSLIQFPPLANSGLALQKHLRDTMEMNNQSMSGNTPEPKDRETKYSFQVRAQDSASVTNGMQSLYESNYQQFQETMYRRAIKTPKGDMPYQKMVQEFKEKCKKDGVPDEALTERAIGQIRERTSAGAGSAAIRLQAIQMLMNSPVYFNAPEDKKIAIERYLVATTMGQVNVSRFARSVTDADLPDQDVSLAQQESNGLAQGGQAIVGIGQDDVAHAQNHLQAALQHMQACEAGQEDPQTCLTALQGLLQHAGEHLAKLQNNPVRKQEFDQLEAQWKQLAQYAQQLQREIQSQQGQPSPQQQLSEDGQIKLQKVQLDAQIKDKKANLDAARKFRQQAFNERLSDAKTGASMMRDTAKTRAGIGLQTAKTQHGMMIDNAKTAATINRNGRNEKEV